ncbi:hypothetical protein Bca4012_081547 [Brassica carinata]
MVCIVVSVCEEERARKEGIKWGEEEGSHGSFREASWERMDLPRPSQIHHNLRLLSPRVSVLTITWFNLAAAATNNISTQTPSQGLLAPKIEGAGSLTTDPLQQDLLSLGNPRPPPPLNYIHQPYHPSSIPLHAFRSCSTRPLLLGKASAKLCLT